jgi:hypothetical protein
MATGLLIGGILGGVGSGIQAAETRRQQARQRRRQRKAIQQAREFTGGTTVSRRGIPDEDIIPGTAVTNEFLEQHGGVPFGLATFQDPTTGERRFGGRVEEILADPLLVQARSFPPRTSSRASGPPRPLEARASAGLPSAPRPAGSRPSRSGSGKTCFRRQRPSERSARICARASSASRRPCGWLRPPEAAGSGRATSSALAS